MTEGRIGELEGLRLAAEPFRHFMALNVRGPDLDLFSRHGTLASSGDRR